MKNGERQMFFYIGFLFTLNLIQILTLGINFKIQLLTDKLHNLKEVPSLTYTSFLL